MHCTADYPQTNRCLQSLHYCEATDPWLVCVYPASAGEVSVVVEFLRLDSAVKRGT